MIVIRVLKFILYSKIKINNNRFYELLCINVHACVSLKSK